MNPHNGFVILEITAIPFTSVTTSRSRHGSFTVGAANKRARRGERCVAAFTEKLAVGSWQ
jgi:hypothetical protein